MLVVPAIFAQVISIHLWLDTTEIRLCPRMALIQTHQTGFFCPLKGSLVFYTADAVIKIGVFVNIEFRVSGFEGVQTFYIVPDKLLECNLG